KSMPQIARESGLSEETLRRGLHHHGLVVRSLSEANRLATSQRAAERAALTPEERRQRIVEEADRGERHWVYGNQGKDFLQNEYVEARKPLRTIAGESGLAEETLRRGLYHHDLPLRSHIEVARAMSVEQKVHWLTTPEGKEYLEREYEQKGRTGNAIAR